MATRRVDGPHWLTTGQIAALCGVAPRTVSKWIDTGLLKGFRLPGSLDRRVMLADLEAFVEAHGMPVRVRPRDLIVSYLAETAVPGCVPAPAPPPVLAAWGRLGVVAFGCAEGVAGAVAVAAATRRADPGVRLGLVLADDVPEAAVPGGVFDWVGRVPGEAVAGVLGPAGSGT